MADATPRRLQKSRRERMLFGVARGVADYLEMDAVLVRVVFVVLCFVGGVGFVAYVALAMFMPEAAEDGEGTSDGPTIRTRFATTESSVSSSV